MRFGLGIPTASEGYYFRPPFADHDQAIALLESAESWGYDSAWFNERFNMPVDLLESGSRQPNFYEVVVAMSYGAAVTKRIHLAQGVLQPSLRDPLLLANQMGTLDQFSKGRAILGVGKGANRQEFVEMRPRSAKAHRGDMLDEFLEVFTLLASQNGVSYSGKYYEYEGVSSFPKPVQEPFPIYLAGRSDNTLRRLARWCSGWVMPISSSPDDVIRRKEELEPLAEKEGRDLSQMDLMAVTVMSLDSDHEKAVKRFAGSRLTEFMGSRSLEEFVEIASIGTPEEAIEKVARMKEAGSTSYLVNKAVARDFTELSEQFQRFAEEVAPHVS